MKYIIIYLLSLFIIIGLVSFIVPPHSVDARTKELCHWYASIDHQHEFTPERWKADSTWIKKFDWYDSCLRHVEYPVAK